MARFKEWLGKGFYEKGCADVGNRRSILSFEVSIVEWIRKLMAVTNHESKSRFCVDGEKYLTPGIYTSSDRDVNTPDKSTR